MFCPSRQRSCICIFKKLFIHIQRLNTTLFIGALCCLNAAFIYVFGNERWLFIGTLCFVSTQRSFMCLEVNAVYWGIVFCLNATFIYVSGNERCLLGCCVLSQRNVHLCVWKRTLFIGALCFVSTNSGRLNLLCVWTDTIWSVHVKPRRNMKHLMTITTTLFSYPSVHRQILELCRLWCFVADGDWDSSVVRAPDS